MTTIFDPNAPSIDSLNADLNAITSNIQYNQYVVIFTLLSNIVNNTGITYAPIITAIDNTNFSIHSNSHSQILLPGYYICVSNLIIKRTSTTGNTNHASFFISDGSAPISQSWNMSPSYLENSSNSSGATVSNYLGPSLYFYGSSCAQVDYQSGSTIYLTAIMQTDGIVYSGSTLMFIRINKPGM